MNFRHHRQLVLQPKAHVKGSQKPLKDLLAMHQKQDLGLGTVYTFRLSFVLLGYVGQL